MHTGPFGLLSDLTQARRARSARSSSWDQSGKNRDNWVIGPGATVVLADIEGPGSITHIWMTQTCRIVPPIGSIHAPLLPMFAGEEIPSATGISGEVVDPDYYRKVLLKIFWDDQEHPSVLVPLGDFFGLLNSIPGTYTSLPLTVSAIESEEHQFGGNAALNSYFNMPFNQRCRIEIENQNTVPYIQYFYIDYELYREPLTPETLYFHAQWNRQNPCDGWAPDLHVHGTEMTHASNLDGIGNYLILEADGKGHYVGCNLAVRNTHGTWWGEGDDMIFVDDDTWPPSLHGTGSEDYFGNAWGMQNHSFPMNGTMIHEAEVPGYQHSYRFHITDAIRFEKRILVTMEHGHANHLSDDWASTAYWYQTLPSKSFGILPVDQRLPTRPELNDDKPQGFHQDERTKVSGYVAKFSAFLDAREQLYEKWISDTLKASQGNILQAADIRRRFMSA
jgi:Protein of unknown function (DUF2961)